MPLDKSKAKDCPDKFKWLSKVGLAEIDEVIEMTDLPLVFPFEVKMQNLLGQGKDVHQIQGSQRHVVNSIRLDLAEQKFITLDEKLVVELKASL